MLVARLFRDLQVASTDPIGIQQLKRRLADHLDARVRFVLNDVNLALAAAAMHPAFGHLDFIADDVVAALQPQMAQWLVDFPSLPLPSSAIDQNARKMPPREVPVDVESILKELVALREHFKKHRKHNDPCYMPSADELKGFVVGVTSLTKINPFSSADPFSFWREDSSPALQRLARICLSVPASSAPSERVFSSSGFTLDP